MLEAVVSGVSTSGSPAKKLSTNPESVRRLQRSFRDFQCLEMLGLSLIDTSVAAVERATWYCMNYGLLANDAALLAVMEKAELSNLATCDKQLQDIPPFQAWTAIDL